MKLKKGLFYSTIGLTAVAVIPTVLTSCSQSIKATTGSIVTSDYETAKYSTLASSNRSIENLVYGSDYNDGNYVFVYGTTANADFRTFLYGANGEYGNTNSSVTEQRFTNSKFFSKFFGDNSLSNGLITGLSVSLILYVDLAPYDETAGGNYDSKTGLDAPTDKYTLEEVLAEANKSGNTYTNKTLPDEYKYKANTYKRTDDSAKTYREFLTYLNSIRSNGGFSDSSGMIAFKKDTDPQKYDAAESSYDSLVTYYQTDSSN